MPTPSDRVVKLFNEGTYIVRIRTTDLYTFVIEATSPKDASDQCLSRVTDAWLPEDATSMRRLSNEIRQVSKVNVSDLTGKE